MSQETIDYSNYSDEELLKMYEEEHRLSNVYDLSQLAKKILLNSLYGACGSPFFLLYNKELARGITLLGQCMINKAAIASNNFISKTLNEKEVKDRRIYSDTDSVLYDSNLHIIKDMMYGEIKIGELYEKARGTIEHTETGKYVKHITEPIMVKTFNKEKGCVEYTYIKYIMKHSTQKKLFFVSCKNNYLTLTEDHSLIINRSNNIQKGSVHDLKESDCLIINNSKNDVLCERVEYIDKWNVIELGDSDCDVYDIETENHMFFANNILVHNSNYLDLTDVLNKLYELKPEADTKQASSFIDRYCQDIEKKCLAPVFNKVTDELNCKECTMFMDREAITIPVRKTGYSGIWLSKKHYFLLVTDMEGFYYGDKPKQKKMGIFSSTSLCPQFLKSYYDQIFVDLITEGPDKARETVEICKKEFFSRPIEDISFIKGVSEVAKFLDTSTGLPYTGEWKDKANDKMRNGGVPAHVKAALYHNYLLVQLGLDKKYEKIKDGDHIKYVYLKENPYHFESVAYKEEFPEEFGLKEYVDKETHFEKLYRKPVSDIFDACGINIENVHSIEEFF